MAGRPVTINVPDALYGQIERRAASSGRSVESELVDLLANVLPAIRPPSELEPELEAELAQLRRQSDDALWLAARSRLSDSQVRRLLSLNRKDQRVGLTNAEARARTADLP